MFKHYDMLITTITGHLTVGNKKAIKAMLSQNIMHGVVGRTTCIITKSEGVYTVIISIKDRGSIPVGGEPLRLSAYTHTFCVS